MKKTTFLFVALALFLPSIYAAEPEVKIVFDKIGALYHVGDEGWAMVHASVPTDAKTDNLCIEIADIDGKRLSITENATVPGEFGRYYYVPFKADGLGYFSVKVSYRQGNVVLSSCEKGYGVIPDVTLRSKDESSPFGVGAHYARYNDWRLGDIQQQLGMAWLRDKAAWKELDTKHLPCDPFIEYLDQRNICWLPIIDYVSAWDGEEDANGRMRFDKEVSAISDYIRMNHGLVKVYESQNEPNNFAGWKKRFPHPEKQDWRPQGWGTAFTDLAIQITDSIRAVDPALKVMWPGEEEWTEFFLDARKETAEHIDLTAIHPYILWSLYPELSKFASTYYPTQKKMLKQHGVSDEIWITETGWTTYTPDSIKRHFPYVTELQQAQLLVRNYLIHLYNGATKVFWYEFVEEPFGVNNPETSFGLLRYDEMLSVKPSAVAYANMVNNFRHLTPVGKLETKDEKTYGFIYQSEGAKKADKLAIWRLDDEKEVTLSLSHTKSVTAVDIFGRKSEYKVQDKKVTLPLSMSVLLVSGINAKDLEKLTVE